MKTIHCIGAGGYAATLLNEALRLFQSGGCTLGAVVVDPKVVAEPQFTEQVAQAKSQGWRVFSSFEDLISQGSSPGDVLLLPLPIHLHAPFVIRALEAGFRVVCEKPVAGTLAEGRRMYEVAVAKEATDRLYFGYQHVLGPGMKEVRRILKTRELGDLLSIRVSIQWPRTIEYYTRNYWAGRLEAAGTRILDSPIQNATAHFVHLMLLTAADQGYEPVRVRASHLRAYPTIDSADTQTLNIEVKNPSGQTLPIFFGVTHASAEEVHPLIQWECRGGTMKWTNTDELLVTRSGHGDRTLPSTFEGHHVFSMPMRAATRGENPDVLGIGYRDSIRHTRVIEAAFQGIDSAHPVPQISERWVENRQSQRVIHGIGKVLEYCSKNFVSLEQGARALEVEGIGWADEVLTLESEVLEN